MKDWEDIEDNIDGMNMAQDISQDMNDYEYYAQQAGMQEQEPVSSTVDVREIAAAVTQRIQDNKASQGEREYATSLTANMGYSAEQIEAQKAKYAAERTARVEKAVYGDREPFAEAGYSDEEEYNRDKERMAELKKASYSPEGAAELEALKNKQVRLALEKVSSESSSNASPDDVATAFSPPAQEQPTAFNPSLSNTGETAGFGGNTTATDTNASLTGVVSGTGSFGGSGASNAGIDDIEVDDIESIIDESGSELSKMSEEVNRASKSMGGLVTELGSLAKASSKLSDMILGMVDQTASEAQRASGAGMTGDEYVTFQAQMRQAGASESAVRAGLAQAGELSRELQSPQMAGKRFAELTKAFASTPNLQGLFDANFDDMKGMSSAAVMELATDTAMKSDDPAVRAQVYEQFGMPAELAIMEDLDETVQRTLDVDQVVESNRYRQIAEQAGNRARRTFVEEMTATDTAATYGLGLGSAIFGAGAAASATGIGAPLGVPLMAAGAAISGASAIPLMDNLLEAGQSLMVTEEEEMASMGSVPMMDIQQGQTSSTINNIGVNVEVNPDMVRTTTSMNGSVIEDQDNRL